MARAEDIRMRRVFVPGGLPEYTYVPRQELGLEKQLRAASDNLCKLVTVTGPTKSGKSVLAQKIYSRESAIWIDGGTVRTEDDLWTQINEKLDSYTDRSVGSNRSSSADISAEISGKVGISFIAAAQAKAAPKIGQARSTANTNSRKSSPRATAIESLRSSRSVLVIDDFHYLEREVQGQVVRALKSLVFEGQPVILIAIPHRKYDAVRVEKEMTGRVSQITMPAWEESELRRIPELGFPLLNVKPDGDIVSTFLTECIGSPHLMQEFCRQLCDDHGIEQRCATELVIGPKTSKEDLFARIAKDTSKAIFDRLAKGPRQRTDRNQRAFRDGRTGDIYVAVLHAIAKLRPGLSRVEYEDVRTALKELLVELPQAHEVSRVLEHMCTIQSADDASAPVLDWEKDERRLHITDPFFAFFLRWGLDESSLVVVDEDP